MLTFTASYIHQATNWSFPGTINITWIGQSFLFINWVLCRHTLITHMTSATEWYNQQALKGMGKKILKSYKTVVIYINNL